MRTYDVGVVLASLHGHEKVNCNRPWKIMQIFSGNIFVEFKLMGQPPCK
jgi:hypothetical protein